MPFEPWSDAWAEAEASAPPAERECNTLELIHPAFVDEEIGQFSVRAVAETFEDTFFTLEEGAPLNGGESVKFKAIPFMADHPEWEEGKPPEVRISIDGVGRDLSPYIKPASRTRANMRVILRQYLLDDPSAPAYGPLEMVGRDVTVTAQRVDCTIRIDDLTNTKFPSLIYTIRRFKTLRQV